MKCVNMIIQKFLKELKNKKFNDVLDCWLWEQDQWSEILREKYPDKLYTGLRI